MMDTISAGDSFSLRIRKRRHSVEAIYGHEWMRNMQMLHSRALMHSLPCIFTVVSETHANGQITNVVEALSVAMNVDVRA